MAILESKVTISQIALRQTAFSVEQLAKGGIERPEPGQLSETDLRHGTEKLTDLKNRLSSTQTTQIESVQAMLERVEKLHNIIASEQAHRVVYVDKEVYGLDSRLRSTALEIDFSFGDRDGRVSEPDLRKARAHYSRVRGPVGWNRLLATDEIERRLYPHRSLRSVKGPKLLPTEWLSAPPDYLSRLDRVSRYLDEATLVRTYADIAARFACAPPSHYLRSVYEGALELLGQEIRKRDSIRPSLTDIARIGFEDPEIKEILNSPIKMSRKLQMDELLVPYIY